MRLTRALNLVAAALLVCGAIATLTLTRKSIEPQHAPAKT